ncbi:MAG: hypothetical protein HRT87_11705 [Legionellales bacterium]|nr:hypothetical protein [Legionellales bacterium]
MAKKRTSLENFIQSNENVYTIDSNKEIKKDDPIKKESDKKRPNVKQQTAYLPIDVYEQLRKLAFEERKKMHDYLLEGLDLVFKDRGLLSIQDIRNKK